MRTFLLISLTMLTSFGLCRSVGHGQAPIELTTHNQSPPAAIDAKSAAANAQAVERIRKIVLNQGDNARALANLIQLARDLPAAATTELYHDLANDYLQNGKYDQAANVLQQLLNQFPNEDLTPTALVQLVRLYSSSEVMYSEGKKKSARQPEQDQSGLLKFALYTANHAIQSNTSLGNDPALTFQRAVATRLGGNPTAAQGRLTRLKRNRNAAAWRTRALAEQWLQSKQEDEPPLPTVTCRQTDERPHLDGQLADSLWQSIEPMQFAYDQEFLYVAISQAKHAGLAYTSDAQPRTHDADLATHDHVQLRLDADRDYATCYELAVDHRGQTQDRCWHDTNWNPQWFVAAAQDATHWTVEAAIPWEQLTSQAPKPGDTWAVAWRRHLPEQEAVPGQETVPRQEVGNADAEAPSPNSDGSDFQLLMFQ